MRRREGVGWNRRRSTRLAFETLLGPVVRLDHFYMLDLVPPKVNAGA
jgi:hypothetical protein